MPGPPVARIRLMSGWLIRWPESATVGFSIQPMISSGAPALTAASSTMRAASMVLFLARGCGLKMMPLRVFSASSDLKIAVEVGFVVGTMPAMTPTGSATFAMPIASFSSMTPQVFMSRYLL